MFVTSNKAMALKRAVLAVFLLAFVVLTLAGCNSILEPADIPAAPKPSVAVSAPVEKPVPVQEPDTASSVNSAPYDAAGEEPADDTGDEEPAADAIVEKPAKPAMESIEAIAAMKDMTLGIISSDYTVRMDSAHNPYDVAWDYGRDYKKYIKAVDEAAMWDVLFDADFYMESFPMLAMLYRYDADLLLEHFQTAGVHEGRQGSAAFNVEAYIEHCDDDIVDAFGDEYECYYFYWALNQDAEADVDVSGDGYAIQLRAEMTLMQRIEFEMVNEYRAEVGADPVVFDSEIAAFACYRATVDMLEGYDGHDWMDGHHAECDAFLDAVGSRHFTENTVHSTSRHGGILTGGCYLDYYNSESHYNAMVNPDQTHFGCSNIYVFKGDSDTTRSVEFDVYTINVSTPLNP